MAYEVISPVTAVKVGAYGAAEGACTSLGGIDEFSYQYKEAVDHAVDPSHGNARVSGYGDSPTFDWKAKGASVTLANLALQLRGTVAGNDLTIPGVGGAITSHAIFVTGYVADGRLKTLQLPAGFVEPGADNLQGVKQFYPELSGGAYYDTAAGYTAKLADVTADTVPPTFVSSVPSTAGSRSTDIDLVFSEALSNRNIDADHFIVENAATHALVVQATTAFHDVGCTTVRLSGGTNWLPAALIEVHYAAVYDVAGNKLAAPGSFTFTAS